MKIRIKKIREGLYRTCYELFGRGETAVPFDTRAEAEAFERGLRYAISDIESEKRTASLKAKLINRDIPQCSQKTRG